MYNPIDPRTYFEIGFSGWYLVYCEKNSNIFSCQFLSFLWPLHVELWLALKVCPLLNTLKPLLSLCCKLSNLKWPLATLSQHHAEYYTIHHKLTDLINSSLSVITSGYWRLFIIGLNWCHQTLQIFQIHGF